MAHVIAPPTVVPRAASVRGYGSSLIIADGHITVVSDRYLTKLAQSLGAKVERNYGVNSTTLIAPSGASLTGWAQIWSHANRDLPTTGGSAIFDVRAPLDPLVVLDHAVNDGGSYGNLTNFQAAFATTLEAALRIFRAGFAWRNTHANFSYGSGWTAQATSTGFGGTRQTHGASTATATFTTPTGFLGGAMTFYAVTRPDANETWTCAAAIDGGAAVTTVVSNALGVSGVRSLVPIHVPGVPAGSGHTVTLSFTSIGAGGMSFLGGTLESQWPPVVMIVGQPTLPTMPPASETNLTQAVLDGLNAGMAAAPALFTDGKVAYVDLSPLNAATKWYEDQLHYSPEGHAKVADLVFERIKQTGGLPTGNSAGPVSNWAGTPDWSGAPGTQVIYDSTNAKVYVPKTVTAGDWIDVATTTGTALVATHEADTTAVHGIADTSALVLTSDTRLTNSRTPSGAAGGVLGGTYPNPSFAADMATQAELDAMLATIDARHRTVKRSTMNARAGVVTGSGTYLAVEGGAVALATATATNWAVIPIRSTDLSLSGRSMKMQILAEALVNATAPGITLTVGLYLVGTPVGISNVFDPAATLVSGTTIAFTTPAADSVSGRQSSGTFDMPADGDYMVGVVASGAMAAASVVMIPYTLEVWGQ